jgi:hypothetical protein
MKRNVFCCVLYICDILYEHIHPQGRYLKQTTCKKQEAGFACVLVITSVPEMEAEHFSEVYELFQHSVIISEIIIYLRSIFPFICVDISQQLPFSPTRHLAAKYHSVSVPLCFRES